jgi:acetyltransferase-like isoleucine patch superfamily enzyme
MRGLRWLNGSILKAAVRRHGLARIDRTARIYWTAKLLNAQRDADRIIIGARTVVLGELFVFGHGGQIDIGRHCYIGEGSRIWSGAKISIGDHVLISHSVSIMDNLTHPIDPLARRRQVNEIYQRGHPREIDLEDIPVRIERDAWIGAHSLVLRGVTIGEGAIVGAGSVVTKDVPPHTIVAGNPARVIRSLSGSES